ncbi:Glutamate racemase [Candidatus Magnetomoraceae bacterium gMMP-15]
MIGIFDSGLGGLTVARAIVDRLPDQDIIYFGDTARTPYESKSPDTVIRYAIQNTEFLLKQGANFIVMACNSASSVATNILREKFDIPIFEVISPAVESAMRLAYISSIGIIGTRATINSGIYVDKIKAINPKISVYSSPCPLLVPLVEEGWLNRPETRMIVKKYLHPLKVRQIDTLILGCTHYPLLKHIIEKKIGKKIRVIDSAQAVAAQIKNFLDKENISPEPDKKGNCRFFVSNITPHFKKVAKSIFKRNMILEVVKNEY